MRDWRETNKISVRKFSQRGEVSPSIQNFDRKEKTETLHFITEIVYKWKNANKTKEST
jgi:hypothetical protein